MLEINRLRFFSSFGIEKVYSKCCLTFGILFTSAFSSVIIHLLPGLLFLKTPPLFCRARAIRFRQDSNEAVGGFFSQIGQLYMVHHLWGKCVYFIWLFSQSASNRLLTLPRGQGCYKSWRKALTSFFFYISYVDFLYFCIDNFIFERNKQN